MPYKKFEELLGPQSSRAIINIIIDYIKNNPVHFPQLIDLCLHTNKQIAMRAAWAVDACDEKIPELAKPYFSFIIKTIKSTSNTSVRRIFLRIFTRKINIKTLSEKQLGLLLDLCLHFLNNPTSTTGIKYNALIIIMHIAKKEPDILFELNSILKTQLQTATPGLKNRILKEIALKKTKY